MNGVIDEAAGEPTREAEREEKEPTDPADEGAEWTPEEAGYGHGV